MSIYLGVPDRGENAALGKRLARLTLARLLFLTVLLGIVARWYLRDVQMRSFSVQLTFIAIACGFVLAGLYAAVLRVGRGYPALAYVQIAFDQLTWTVLVYASGGANSGLTSLYGLGVLSGAILLGLRAASFAAGLGYVVYFGLCALMFTGVLPPPPDQGDVHYASTLGEFAFPLGLNLLVLVVVTMLAGYLAERLRTTGGELEAATERARTAERLAYLGQLAAGLAHEIRNPLGSISASIELLRDAPMLSPDEQRLCDIIKSESLRLNDLVSDMLDLGRPKKPVPIPCDLRQAALDVVELASRQGRGAQDVQVAYRGPDTPVTVTADSRQLRQVIWNLVKNAVQATAPGTEVLVEIILAEKSGQVVLRVTDHGPGIPPEAQAQIFEAFFSTRSHGVGIGLAVVKRVVDEHGWRIEVHSEAGMTSFEVIIDAEA